MNKLDTNKDILITALKEGLHVPAIKRTSIGKKKTSHLIFKKPYTQTRVENYSQLKRRNKLIDRVDGMHKSKIKALKGVIKDDHRFRRRYFLRANRKNNVYILEAEYNRYVKKPNRASRRKLAELRFAKAIKLVQFKSMEDTHNQGQFKWDGKLITLFSHLNPTSRLKRKWTDYLSHLHLLALKKPFRFDHALISNYRLVGKLMTYYFNKRDNAYDIHYDVGTHERVLVSTKELWSVDEKYLYNKIRFNRKWSPIIYNSYEVDSDVVISPIDTCNNDYNGLLLERHIAAPWQYDPIYELSKLRTDFFRPLKGTIFDIDKIHKYYGPSSNMYWLTAPYLFQTFFMSSFFQSKEIEYPYRFFKWLDTLNDHDNDQNKDIFTLQIKKCNFNHNCHLAKSVKFHMFMRLMIRINSIKDLLYVNDVCLPTKPKTQNFKPSFDKAKISWFFKNSVNYLNSFFLLHTDLPIVLDQFTWTYLKLRKPLKIIKPTKKLNNKSWGKRIKMVT